MGLEWYSSGTEVVPTSEEQVMVQVLKAVAGHPIVRKMAKAAALALTEAVVSRLAKL